MLKPPLKNKKNFLSVFAASSFKKVKWSHGALGVEALRHFRNLVFFKIIIEGCSKEVNFKFFRDETASYVCSHNFFNIISVCNLRKNGI